MTDKQIFEKFMRWMGMKLSKTKTIGKKTVVQYDDTYHCDARVTKTGYEEFYAGLIFDENENIVKAYIDSHVAHSSENCDKISEMLK
tara:strand:- start:275 stop:535 length:261 start_codon:yes stop_codon:yes gene_type:complete